MPILLQLPYPEFTLITQKIACYITVKEIIKIKAAEK